MRAFPRYAQGTAYLGNETIADAMMDRLIHTAHKIELSGPSMRELLANN